MDITKSDVLTLALILSLALNFYELYQRSGIVIMDDRRTYSESEEGGGGEEIDTDAARRLVDAYAGRNTPTAIRGFMFSKRAYVDMFLSEERTNAIAMYLVGDDINNLKLIMKGVTTDKTDIRCEYDNHIFITQTLCPADCFGW